MKNLFDLGTRVLSPAGLLFLILILTGELGESCKGETGETGGSGGDGGSAGEGGSGGDGGSGAMTGGGGETSTGGSGGDTTTGTGGTGSVADCYPTNEDPTAAGCAGVGSCKCHEMTTVMPDGATCPYTAGNTCTPGHAQCGCDLPLGEDYVLPDANCKKLVNGDTWTWTAPDDTTYSGLAQWDYDDNGQVVVGLDIFTVDISYFTNLTMSGKNLFWNLKNPDLEQCAGKFADDCKTINLECWHGGETNPYVAYAFYYFSP